MILKCSAKICVYCTHQYIHESQIQMASIYHNYEDDISSWDLYYSVSSSSIFFSVLFQYQQGPGLSLFVQQLVAKHLTDFWYTSATLHGIQWINHSPVVRAEWKKLYLIQGAVYVFYKDFAVVGVDVGYED